MPVQALASADGDRPVGTLTVLLVAALFAAAFSELANRLTGVEAFRYTAWAGGLGVLILSQPFLKTRERILILACLALSALALAIHDDPAALLASSFDQGLFLMSFMLLLGLLHAAASTSPTIATMGEFLTRQPPGRRYYVLNGGTAAMAVLFNLGILSFLVPLVQRGIERATPGDALNPIRERRQITALMRGFAWAVTWSPTAFAPVIVTELMPGVDRSIWMVYGLILFAALLVLGGAEDRVRFRAIRLPGKRPVMPFPGKAALRFLVIAVTFLGIAAAVIAASGETVILGILTACPIVAFAWIALQLGAPAPGSAARLRGRLSHILTREVAGAVGVTVTLACSGFIGRAAAGLVPAAEVARTIGLDTMPDWVLLTLIPPFIVAISHLALSPTTMAVFLGSFFAALPSYPADPTLIAFSISCGWALSMTISPLSTVVLMVERISSIPATTLTWRWNAAFSLLTALLLIPGFWLLTGGT